jgi:recombination associated protein RdgC
MWFNSALVYQYELNENVDLNELLSEEALKPCPPHARFTYGWVPNTQNSFAYEIAECSIICLGKEERILPRTVIQKHLSEKILELERQRGFAVKKAEKGQIAEDIEFNLLPKAFCLQKKVFAFLDSISKRIIINSSSANQASQLLATLRKSVPSIKIEPISHENNISSLFASWIKNPDSLPKQLSLAPNCVLFCTENEKKQFSCKGYESVEDEILVLLSQGLVASEISLIWNERVQFTLTQDLVFKKLKCLDYLVDEFQDAYKEESGNLQQDAALTILTKEFRNLFDYLLPILTANQKTSAPALENCEV